MGKYHALGEFLRAQKTSEVPLTFKEIERIVGVPLPPKSQRQRAWWSNNPSNNVMTRVWLDAGFRTERVDIEGRKLVFRRTAKGSEKGSQQETGRRSSRRGNHPLFGALRDLLRPVAGADLTQPADPHWGDEG